MNRNNQRKMIEWNDLTLESNSKTILEGESGNIKSNTLNAILGTSGAGKTMLLNALSGLWLDSLDITGNILVNGKERCDQNWMKNAAYVGQFFYAYENQTVYETMKFSAFLKIKFKSQNYEENIKTLILEIIELVGLDSVKDKFLYEISKGERKRVCIGLELIGNPAIIFLDEPTFGLDSLNSLNTIQILKKLTSKGKTIILTIHEPSYLITNYFDHIIIMSQCVSLFQGNLKQCLKFFKSEGIIVPKNANACDYFLYMISFDQTTKENEMKSQERIDKLTSAWKKILIKRKNKISIKKKIAKKNNTNETSSDFSTRENYNEINLFENNSSHDIINHDSRESDNLLSDKNIFRSVARNSFILLLARNMKEIWRDKYFLKIQIIQKFAFILLVGLTYLQLGYSQESIQSRTGAIFLILINSLFETAGPIFSSFPDEKRIIAKERKLGLYNGYYAYMSKLIILFIYLSFFSLIYTSAVYWMIGLNPKVGRFFIYLIIQISAVFFSIALGLTIGTLAPTQLFSQLCGTTILIIFIIFGGGLNNPSTIPVWLRWIIWISPINYSFRASIQNQYRGLNFEELPGEMVVIEMGFNSVSTWACIFAIWGLTLFWIILGAFSLHLSTRIRLKIKINPKK